MLGFRSFFYTTDIPDFMTAGRALVSCSATGLSYSSGTGVLSLSTGYVIPTTTEESNWNSAYGWGNHAGLYDAAGAASSAVSGHNSAFNHSQLHALATLDANADTLLSISGQALGLDNQTANRVFAGPTSGNASAPTFRALVSGDLPTIAVGQGGTGKTSWTQYGIVYASATDTLSQIASGTSGQVLRSAGSAAATWSTATYPDTTTAYQVLYSSSANTLAGSTIFLFDGGTLLVGGTAFSSTRSPRLEVRGSSRSLDHVGLLFVASTDDYAINKGGSIGLGGLNGAGGNFDPWSFATVGGYKENATSGNYCGYFAIATAGSGGTLAERIRVTSAGYVGVGITSPECLHHVYANSGAQSILESVSDTTASNYIMRRALAGRAQVNAAAVAGNFSWTAYDGSSYQYVAILRGGSEGSVSSTSSPGYISFLTTPSSSTSPTEKLRITSAGSVIIGAQSALATDATDGFLYIPTCAGTPSGTPTSYTGKVPIIYDTTNNYLYVYNGAWKKVGLS